MFRGAVFPPGAAAPPPLALSERLAAAVARAMRARPQSASAREGGADGGGGDGAGPRGPPVDVSRPARPCWQHAVINARGEEGRSRTPPPPPLAAAPPPALFPEPMGPPSLFQHLSAATDSLLRSVVEAGRATDALLLRRILRAERARARARGSGGGGGGSTADDDADADVAVPSPLPPTFVSLMGARMLEEMEDVPLSLPQQPRPPPRLTPRPRPKTTGAGAGAALAPITAEAPPLPRLGLAGGDPVSALRLAASQSRARFVLEGAVGAHDVDLLEAAAEEGWGDDQQPE